MLTVQWARLSQSTVACFPQPPSCVYVVEVLQCSSSLEHFPLVALENPSLLSPKWPSPQFLEWFGACVGLPASLYSQGFVPGFLA